MGEKVKLAIIDDNDEDIEVNKRLFESSGEIDVEGINPRDIQDLKLYSGLASVGETDVVVVDQRLDEQAGVSYDGLDIADYLRTIRPELPIYIFTQYGIDLGSRAREVENVVDKKEFGKMPEIFVKRILRATKRYDEAMTEKQKRIIELIDMKTKGVLSKDDEEELEKLRAEIERVETLAVTDKLSECKGERSEESKLLSEALEQLRKLTSAPLAEQKDEEKKQYYAGNTEE